MLVISKEEYRKKSKDYKGIFMDYQGTHPHLKGRRTL